MKRWAWVVAGLYGLILAVLTAPVLGLAFAPKIKLTDTVAPFVCWPYWLWLAVMGLSQLALLAVPVRVAGGRPATRRSLWPTLLAGGMMAGVLAAGACFSLGEFIFRDQRNDDVMGWTALGLCVLTWGAWALIFFRTSRSEEPADWISRQCRWLLRGSILELLIAVPTHIIARYRDYCCAGFMTFIGLTMGISVMLFAFGPALFFLFIERWKRLHPAPLDQVAGGCRTLYPDSQSTKE